MTNEPRLTVENLREMLELVQADREARQVFLSMPREDQLLSILGMIAYTNSQIANLQKGNVEYRHAREQREMSHRQELVDTGEVIAVGIKRALEERYARSTKIVDSVIINLTTIIAVALLVLAFHRISP